MKKCFRLALSILLAAVFLSNTDSAAQVRGKALYDLMGEENLVVTTGLTRVTWLPDGQGYLESETDPATGAHVFYAVNPKNQKRSRLFGKDTVNGITSELNRLTGRSVTGIPFKRFSYQLDCKAMTFTFNDEEYLYYLKEKRMRRIKKPDIEKQPGSEDLMRNMLRSQLWNGTLSPDFNYLAYVKNYDIYIYNTETGREEQVTFGGSEEFQNGQPDWVYPEELRQLDAYWWSPDGKMIAYLQFDVREEYKYPIVHELKPESRLELQRYPKAGEENPTVKLFVVDIATKKSVEVETNSSGNVYIVRPVWLKDSSELTFRRLNRRQNKLELLSADPATGSVRTILVEEEDSFVRLHDDFILLEDGEHFLWSSERTGWRHLYLYDLQKGLVKQLTDGEWEVGGITAVDEEDEWVYFTGYTDHGFANHFYRVKLDGSDFTQLTEDKGSHRISIDPAGKYYLDNFSSLTVPPTVGLYESNGKFIRNTAQSNIDRIRELGLEEPEFVWVKAADGITDIYGVLFKPAGFNPAKTYPLVVSVYGGPAKRVRNSYMTADSRARLAQLGFVVWELDGRGTLNRGKKFLAETYLKFGQADVDDQAAGVRQIAQRPYVDGSRVAMFGGSYGGYMTCMSLLRYPDVYTVGHAGSSVTDWRNYDSIYTERYMRTPQENPEGYDKGSALKYAQNLKGKLLLTHGSVDNNVHPGNTIQLIEELQRAGKQFDLMYYPEQRHGIRGFHRDHLTKLRISYFLKHLKPENWEESLHTVW